MSSTYSTNLAIELIGTGDQAGTWGTTTNSNLGTLIEQSISGYVTQAVSTGTDTTITIPNGSSGVARNMYIELTGTGGASTNLIVPANKKLYFIFNNSSGAVTVKVSGQTGVSVPTGKKMVLVSNGTDIVNGLNYIADFATNSFTVTNLTASSGTITNLIATSGSITNLVSSDASATVLRAGSATITNLLATSLAVSSIATFAAGSAAAPSITTTGDTNTGLFFPAADTIAFTEGGVEAARIDSSGNLGLGVTPSAWFSASRVYQFGSGGALEGRTSESQYLALTANQYIDSAGDFKYIGSTFASRYQQYNGVHSWSTAPSGTAGNTITFTQAMTLTAAGNLGIGISSPSEKIHIFGSATAASPRILIQSHDTPSATAGLLLYGRDSSNNNKVCEIATSNDDLTFKTNNTEKMRLTASGTLGLGVTPSAWSVVSPAIQLGSAGTFFAGQGATAALYLGTNAYYDGANFKYSITGAATYHQQNGGAHRWYNAASGTAGDTITFTQAMTLDASGNLLVGTTTHQNYSGGTTEITIGTTASGATAGGAVTFSSGSGLLGYIAAQESATAIGSATSAPMLFNTNNTERARITAAGELLVNNTTLTGGYIAVRQGALYSLQSDTTSTGAGVGHVLFTVNGATVGTITTSNTTTAYNTSSDRRLKDNIAPADNAGSVIDAIEVVKHDWKAGGHTRYGMIAQDLHSVAPEAVSVGDADDVEDFKKPWAVDYSKLVPMLVKEVQSLRKRVAELESK